MFGDSNPEHLGEGKSFYFTQLIITISTILLLSPLPPLSLLVLCLRLLLLGLGPGLGLSLGHGHMATVMAESLR